MKNEPEMTVKLELLDADTPREPKLEMSAEEIRMAVLDPAYRDGDHPKHREAVDRATVLYERRYRD